jgi:hypothetical protein
MSLRRVLLSQTFWKWALEIYIAIAVTVILLLGEI